MFHITFVQISVFDWLSGRQKGSIFVKMFKNLPGVLLGPDSREK